MKLKTLLIAGASLVAFAGADALAGGHMKAGEKGRKGKKGPCEVVKQDGPCAPSAADCMWKSGFSAGAMVGWQNFKPKSTKVTEFNAAGVASTPTRLKTETSNGVVGGVFVGYDHFIRNFLMGLHTGGEWNSGKSKKTTAVPETPATASLVNRRVRTEVSKRWSWLLHAKFGYATGKFLPYVKLGTAYSGFRAKAKATQRFDGTDLLANQVVRGKFNDKKWAFAPAVGVDYAVNKKVTVGLEAMCQHYGKIKTKTRQVSGNQRAFARYKPQVWTVKAGVAYRM